MFIYISSSTINTYYVLVITDSKYIQNMKIRMLNRYSKYSKFYKFCRFFSIFLFESLKSTINFYKHFQIKKKTHKIFINCNKTTSL